MPDITELYLFPGGEKQIKGGFSSLLPSSSLTDIIHINSFFSKKLINSEEKSLFSHKRDDIALIRPALM